MSTKGIAGHCMVVDILNTKTYVPRQFVITDGSENVSLLGIIRKYIGLRREHTSHQRFFVGYRSGKCIVQPVGINTFGQMPKKIATFLGLENCELYTGHCFRRSSATLLANAGVGMTSLKRHGGWKSATVAEGYIQDSMASKCKIAKSILGDRSNSLVSAGGAVTVSATVSAATMSSANESAGGTGSVSSATVSTMISSQEVVIRKGGIVRELISAKKVEMPSGSNILQGCSFENCEIHFK